MNKYQQRGERVYDWQFRSAAPLLVVNTSRQKSETVHITTISRMSQTQTNALEVPTAQATAKKCEHEHGKLVNISEREREGSAPPTAHKTAPRTTRTHER
jgi:hypothetical protein